MARDAAPICVLDEVDAPLDDANVERFRNPLDEMIRLTDTRFVIITHNPITMARMNRLFGATMAERGVSQLVSRSISRSRRSYARRGDGFAGCKASARINRLRSPSYLLQKTKKHQ